MDRLDSLKKIMCNMENGIENHGEKVNKFTLCRGISCRECYFYSTVKNTGCCLDHAYPDYGLFRRFIYAVNCGDYMRATFYLESFKEKINKYENTTK